MIMAISMFNYNKKHAMKYPKIIPKQFSKHTYMIDYLQKLSN